MKLQRGRELIGQSYNNYGPDVPVDEIDFSHNPDRDIPPFTHGEMREVVKFYIEQTYGFRESSENE